MGRDFLESLTTIGLAIVGVAIIAVLVSRNSQTPAVIQSAGSAYSNALDTAISPVTGATTAPNLSYPGGSNYSFGSGLQALVT